MIQIIFKNLTKSDLARDFAIERISTIVDRFPELQDHRIDATLSMENSPTQAGLDLFTVKLFVNGKRFKSVTIQKSAPNLYAALADVVEHSLERLNRYGDKNRVKRRTQTRKALSFMNGFTPYKVARP